jgi:hypothetical protein
VNICTCSFVKSVIVQQIVISTQNSRIRPLSILLNLPILLAMPDHLSSLIGDISDAYRHDMDDVVVKWLVSIGLGLG